MRQSTTPDWFIGPDDLGREHRPQTRPAAAPAGPTRRCPLPLAALVVVVLIFAGGRAAAAPGPQSTPSADAAPAGSIGDAASGPPVLFPAGPLFDAVLPQTPSSPPPEGAGLRTLLSGVASDFASLPSRENLAWTLFGGTLTAVVSPLDDQVNQHLAGLNGFFASGKVIGQGYVQVAAAVATYAYGRASQHPKVSHVGMDLMRAQIVAGALTYALKLTVRRERPDGSDNLSFPSGHAAVTFATAAVLERHFGWWSLPAFAAATYTAASRLHENVHFLSDVVAGATVGMIAGRTVTRHGKSSYVLVPMVGPGRVAFVVRRVPTGN